MFGTDVLRNAVHGSSNPEHAHRAIELIFGTTEFAPEAGAHASARPPARPTTALSELLGTFELTAPA